MILFTIIFTLLAIACLVTFYLDAKIQRHIFDHHPKLWDLFGFPKSSSWFADALATNASEFNLAECKLIAFVKSPKCEELGDVELIRLKALNKLVHQIIAFIALCVLIVGYITFLT